MANATPNGTVPGCNSAIFFFVLVDLETPLRVTTLAETEDTLLR